MSDKQTDTADVPPKKKGKLGKIIIMAVGGIVLIGGGVGAGLYASGSGMIGGGGHSAEDANKPKLVLKSQQKRPSAEEGKSGGEGEGGSEVSAHEGKPTPEGEGGERYASNYYALEKEFTANLQDSVHFIQVGIAVSTPYDEKVIQNIKANDIAIRSAILMALGDTTEDQVFTSQGKTALSKRLVTAINTTLKQKEGFGGVGNVYFTNFVVQ